MKLTESQITTNMHNLNDWELANDMASIHKSWRFKSFEATVGFFNQVAQLAENHNHHPEFLTCYTNMHVKLWTHDSGGLTSKDFELAQAIDQLKAIDPK